MVYYRFTVNKHPSNRDTRQRCRKSGVIAGKRALSVGKLGRETSAPSGRGITTTLCHARQRQHQRIHIGHYIHQIGDYWGLPIPEARGARRGSAGAARRNAGTPPGADARPSTQRAAKARARTHA